MSINLTLIGQAISFALFVFFCMRFVWPPIMQALRARQKTISDGLLAADQAKQDLAQAQQQAQQQLDQARHQAEAIVASANKQAQHIIATARSDAEQEGQRIVQAAQQEAERTVRRARDGLVNSLGHLVAQGVTKILHQEVDIKRHRNILTALEKQLQ